MYSEKSVAGMETANCSTQQGSLPGACASLAFPYIPMQGKNPKQYDRREALQQGTLFPGLDLPFHRELKSRFPAVNSALSELMALDFAVDELGLYLTTHADDKEALELYKARTITEAEYLAKMRDILEDYRTGKSAIAYPDRIRANVHAQAFYGVLTAIFSNEKLSVEPDFAAEMALDITTIIEKHSQVDWTHNLTIHDRISQDIDDLFYRYQKEMGLVLSFDVIDMIIENVKTVALRRFA